MSRIKLKLGKRVEDLDLEICSFLLHFEKTREKVYIFSLIDVLLPIIILQYYLLSSVTFI